MTATPQFVSEPGGRVREIVPIDFPSPRRLPLRESADFVQRVAHLRRVLESC